MQILQDKGCPEERCKTNKDISATVAPIQVMSSVRRLNRVPAAILAWATRLET
jgi:hypothetical protein